MVARGEKIHFPLDSFWRPPSSSSRPRTEARLTRPGRRCPRRLRRIAPVAANSASFRLLRALEARDGGCRFPGCENRRFLDAHHVRHWIDGGATSLENTALLCRRHHRFVHEHGFAIERRGDTWVFRDPDGAIVPATWDRPPVAPGALERFRAAHRASRSGIGAWTACATGGRPDYHACIRVLTVSQ